MLSARCSSDVLFSSHPFHCGSVLFLHSWILTLGLYPGLSTLLDKREYSRKHEKRRLFPDSEYASTPWFKGVSGLKVDDSCTFPVLHLLSKPMISAP